MKNKTLTKIILVSVLTVMLVASCIIATAAEAYSDVSYAADSGELESLEPTVTIESKTAYAGQEFDVNIYAKDLTSVKAMLIDDIVYDTDVLTLVSAKWNVTVGDGEIADWSSTENVGTLGFEQNTSLEGSIFTFTFKAAEDVNATYDISCSVVANERVGSEDVPIEFTLVDGSVKIIGYVRGDMDHDGDVDSSDAIYLLRHVLIPSRYAIEQNGDVNCDGVVTTDDAIYLLRHTFDKVNYPLGCEGEHVFATTPTYTAANGGFTTPCTVCGVDVLLREQPPSFLLTFDEDVATEAAKYDIGLSIYDDSAESKSDWSTTEDDDGNKSLYVNGNDTITYINIVDPSKLADLGTFVMSFDYTTVNESAAGSAASIISILNNNQNGAATSAGSISYGWMMKYIEDNDVVATVKDPATLADGNNIGLSHGTKCKVKIIIEPTAKIAYVYINGTCIGNAGQIAKIAELKDENASIRFGDGPACGHTFDNFAISALK